MSELSLPEQRDRIHEIRNQVGMAARPDVMGSLSHARHALELVQEAIEDARPFQDDSLVSNFVLQLVEARTGLSSAIVKIIAAKETVNKIVHYPLPQ